MAASLAPSNADRTRWIPVLAVEPVPGEQAIEQLAPAGISERPEDLVQQAVMPAGAFGFRSDWSSW